MSYIMVLCYIVYDIKPGKIKQVLYIKYNGMEREMDEYHKKALKEAGINIDALYKRFMGNDVLMGSYLMKFARNGNFRKLQEEISVNNVEEAFIEAHKFKGLCAELYIETLEGIICELSCYLKYGDIEPVRGIMSEAACKYEALSETIKAVYGQYNVK